MRRATTRLAGLLLVLLGAWGGVVAFVGPRLGYRMDTASAWQWTTARWELHAAPGAAVVLAGLLLLAGSVAAARLGALLGVLGGMWFVVGPLFASLWLGTNAETKVASNALSEAARPLGYHYGTGLLIVTFAAYAWGKLATRVSVAPYPAEAAPAPAPTATVATPTATASTPTATTARPTATVAQDDAATTTTTTQRVV